MKLIYVSGPYRNDNEYEVFKNIIHAMKKSRELWKKGWVAICPHLNSMYMGLNPSIFIAGDLEIISRCDAIFMLNGWKRSEGAEAENYHAIDKGIPRFYELDGEIPLPGDIE